MVKLKGNLLWEIKEFERTGDFEIAEKKRREYEEILLYWRRERYKKKNGSYDGFEDYEGKDRYRRWRDNNPLKVRYRHYINIHGIKIQRNLSNSVLEIIYNNLKRAYMHEKVEVEVSGDD